MADDGITFDTITDDQIAERMKKLRSCDPDEINDIYDEFSRAAIRMLTFSKKKCSKMSEEVIVEVDRLARLINLAPNFEKFHRSYDKLYIVRDKILNRDDDFFIKKDYTGVIKKDEKEQMLETLKDVILNCWHTLDEQDKNFYWTQILLMLKQVLRFKKLLQDKLKTSEI
jgi:hypothetical protein